MNNIPESIVAILIILSFIALLHIILRFNYRKNSIPETNKQINQKISQFINHRQNFENILINFFCLNTEAYPENNNYPNVLSQLEQQCFEMEGIISEIQNELWRPYRKPVLAGNVAEFIIMILDLNYEMPINVQFLTEDYDKAVKSLEAFKSYNQRKTALGSSINIMQSGNYGKTDIKHINKIKQLPPETVKSILNAAEKYASSRDIISIASFDLIKLFDCFWYYAFTTPYSADEHKKAISLFQKFYAGSHIDTFISNLYAKTLIGGEKSIQKEIAGYIEYNRSADKLSYLASSLMWMNAYNAEATVLQHMLQCGVEMSSKHQERLHLLSRNGGNSPNGLEVSSNGSTQYIDVSSLTWKDEQYVGFFDNLSFRGETLRYSLAIRDEDKELLTTKMAVNDINEAFNYISAELYEEYGDTVSAQLREFTAVSGKVGEKMIGVLIIPKECSHMQIFVHIAGIGKKMNIKYYTIYTPQVTAPSDQQQQALSIKNKLGHTITLWETGIKTTSTMAIQKLLNTIHPKSQKSATPQTVYSNNDSESPIF